LDRAKPQGNPHDCSFHLVQIEHRMFQGFVSAIHFCATSFLTMTVQSETEMLSRLPVFKSSNHDRPQNLLLSFMTAHADSGSISREIRAHGKVVSLMGFASPRLKSKT